ncbi:MAG: hypothetical protein ABL961_02695 [Vicinamibacterales bacterium]
MACVPDDFKPLLRFERIDQVRTYCLRVVSPGVELWRVTESMESEAEDAAILKEDDLASVDEALALIEDIQRSLRAAGWRQT